MTTGPNTFLLVDLCKQIAELTNKHGYMSGVDRESDRVKATGEVYTPTDLVIEIVQKVLETDPEAFAPGKTVIDPACGDGQFLEVVKHFKMLNYELSLEEALDDIYGIDIMPDNVEVCRKRLGGGHIVCDNGLDPQTDEVREWFGLPPNNPLEQFFR